MNIVKWILLAISVLILVGPIGAALIIYRENLAALVMPKTPEFMTTVPQIEFVGYQITDPLEPPLLKFRITNAYNINLTLNLISAKVFCSAHNTLLGFANETASTSIPAKSSAIISLALTFTSAGEAHIFNLHLGGELDVSLRELAMDIQGIELRYEEQVGPISIPRP